MTNLSKKEMEIQILDKGKTMSSREIAEATGKSHDNVLKAIRNMESAWEKVSGVKFNAVKYNDVKGESRPMYELTKRECLYVATKFNDEARARLIIRWEELETKRIVDSGREKLEMAIIFAESASRILNFNENSRLLMYQNIANKFGVGRDLLPSYAQSKGVLVSLSKILEGTAFSARNANPILEASGVLVKRWRKSSKGKMKYFWNITERYFNLGENQVCPNNPKETQPMYFESAARNIIEILMSAPRISA